MVIRSRGARALVVALSMLCGSGCIAGMGRIGAEAPRNFRAMIVDHVDYGRGVAYGHEGDVGNRLGLVLGAQGAGALTGATDAGRPGGFAGNALMQVMVLARPGLAFGGALGVDYYLSTGGANQSQLFAPFADFRASLGMTERASVHLGAGLAYGHYKIGDGDDTLYRGDYRVGGHATAGVNWIFAQNRRASWGLRVEANADFFRAIDLGPETVRPMAGMLGAQLVWLTGK